MSHPKTERELDAQLRALAPDRWIDGPDFRLLARKRVTIASMEMVLRFFFAPLYENLFNRATPLFLMLPKKGTVPPKKGT